MSLKIILDMWTTTYQHALDQHAWYWHGKVRSKFVYVDIKTTCLWQHIRRYIWNKKYKDEKNEVQHSMDQIHYEHERESSPERAKTLWSLKADLKCCKEENKNLIRKKKEQARSKIMSLQNLSYMQGLLWHASNSWDIDKRHVGKAKNRPHMAEEKLNPISYWYHGEEHL